MTMMTTTTQKQHATVTACYCNTTGVRGGGWEGQSLSVAEEWMGPHTRGRVKTTITMSTIPISSDFSLITWDGV